MLRSFREKEFYHPFIIWVTILCWYILIGSNLLSSPRAKLAHIIDSHSFWFLNKSPKVTDEITIVAIDQASRRDLDIKWPWNRSVTAKLIRNIASFSPQAIGLDIIFSGTSEKDEDMALASALRSHPRVVLGYTRQSLSHDRPNEIFAMAASSKGFVDKRLEQGLVSSTQTYERDNSGMPQFSMELALLREYFQLDEGQTTIDERGVFLNDKLFISSPGGTTPINYLVYPTGFRTISASRVIENRVEASDLEGKIVLVGATDPLIHDEHPTILGNLPGVTILANTLVMFLSNRFVQQPPMGTGLLFAFLLGCLIIIINKELHFFRASFLSVCLLVLAYLSLVVLRSKDFTYPYFFILFSGITGSLAYNGYKYAFLLYVMNKIRMQAIVDPLTGLYSPRYFMLQLREKLKTRHPMTFLGVRIGNYHKLSIDLGFDHLKEMMRNLGTLISTEVSYTFPKTSVSRLSADTLGIDIGGEHTDRAKAFWGHLLGKVKAEGAELGNNEIGNALKACLIYKPKTTIATETDLLFQMDELLKYENNGDTPVETLGHGGDERETKTTRMDMLDFITYDWEERNKDLERHIKELVDSNRHLNKLNWGILNALARTIDAKSPWTAGHSERVTAYALKLGRRLRLTQKELDDLHRAGLLHDIGKLAIPAHILDKPGKLTEDEHRVVCKHPVVGARILEPIEDYAEIIHIVVQHHERFDGKGYPHGVCGEDICFGARILAVADVFDALTSDRPYRAGMDIEQAVAIIRESGGTQFDPKVVDAFLTLMPEAEELPISEHGVSP